MGFFEEKMESIRDNKAATRIQVQTLGNFKVWRDGEVVAPKAWGRSKTVELFEFFVTSRRRKAVHKEQILDRLWEEDLESGDS